MEILLTTTARHLTPGDATAGFTVSQSRNFPDGTREFKFVVPYTVHSMTVTVREEHLDAVTFPLTARGDAHSPSARNLVLGLPEDLHKPVYTRPEPVAVYPVGTLVKDIKGFDRSIKVAFACPEHPTSAWVSKDPYSSSHFAQNSKMAADCTHTRQCKINVGDYVLTHEYLPTRNG